MRPNSFGQRLRSLFFRRKAEGDLNDELKAHLELQFRKHLAAGMSEKEARRLAHIEFGGVEQVREECREVDRWRWIDASARNLKHCFRSLGRSPGFVAVSLLLLTVGIGSNVAVFSTVDAVLLRPLPVERPEELVKISLFNEKGRLHELPSTGLTVLEKNRTLQGVCGFDGGMRAVEIAGTVRPTGVAGFTGNCFKTLGLRLQLGRPLTPEDNHPGTEGVAVITDSLWQREFGGKSNALGKPLKINGQLYTIVGVTQKSFTGLLLGSPQEVMTPLLQRSSVLLNGRKQTWYFVSVLARRAPGVSQEQAQAGILAQKTQLLAESVPPSYNAAQRKTYLSQDLDAVSGRNGVDYWLRRRFSEPLYAVFAICALTLLLACVNLTSLLLARSFGRRREISVRLALGAKPRQVAGLFLLENAILTLAGAVVGVLAGLWTAQAILAQGSRIFFASFHLQVGFDERVALFAAALAGLVLLVFAGASVWQAGRLSQSDSLKESGRGVVTTNSLAQKLLAGTQIALTLAFVAASVLLGASLRNMYRINFGINLRNLWEVSLAGRVNIANPAAFFHSFLEEIESLPDVQSASFTDIVPFYNHDYREPVSAIENAHIGEAQARLMGAGDKLFRTLGAKIIAGEDFRRNDSPSGEPTVILSESLARHFGNPRDLIGRHVRMGSEGEYGCLTVVGVASDMDLNLFHLNDTKPFTIYLNIWQHRTLQGYPVLLVRTKGDALPIAAIQRAIKQRGYQYVDRVTTISSEIDIALVENRFLAYLSGWFGVLALVLAAVGLFGLLSYQVSNRTGEIGVRMALGAQRPQIQWLILRQILPTLAWGSLAGLGLTLALGKLMASFFYGVSGYNAPLLLVSVAVLAITAATAAWIPVQRASSVDPMQALRHE